MSRVTPRGLRAVADLVEDVIRCGDIAECAAPCEGEVGRQSAIDNRDSFYEEPVEWLRGYAASLAGGEA